MSKIFFMVTNIKKRTLKKREGALEINLKNSRNFPTVERRSLYEIASSSCLPADGFESQNSPKGLILPVRRIRGTSDSKMWLLSGQKRRKKGKGKKKKKYFFLFQKHQKKLLIPQDENPSKASKEKEVLCFVFLHNIFFFFQEIKKEKKEKRKEKKEKPAALGSCNSLKIAAS